MASVFDAGGFSAQAGAAFTAADVGKFLKWSSGQVVLCDTVGEQSIGVLADHGAGAVGSPVEVHCGRVTKVRAGGTLSVGANIKTATTGKASAASAAVTNTSDAGAASDALIASFCMGTIHEAATADLDLVTAYIAPMGAIPTTAA